MLPITRALLRIRVTTMESFFCGMDGAQLGQESSAVVCAMTAADDEMAGSSRQATVGGSPPRRPSRGRGLQAGQALKMAEQMLAAAVATREREARQAADAARAAAQPKGPPAVRVPPTPTPAPPSSSSTALSSVVRHSTAELQRLLLSRGAVWLLFQISNVAPDSSHGQLTAGSSLRVSHSWHLYLAGLREWGAPWLRFAICSW